MKRRLHELERRVVALPRLDRPEDAASAILAACGNSNAKGIVVAIVEQTGVIDLRLCGAMTNREMCWIGARITRLAMGDEE